MSILERNDPDDATHENPNGKIAKLYLYHNNKWYYYQFDLGHWAVSLNKGGWHSRNLIRLNKKQENKMKEDYSNGEIVDSLDVPRLIKVGKELQYRFLSDDHHGEWNTVFPSCDEDDFTLGDLINSRYEWRIKPESINANLLKPKSVEVDPVTGAVGLVYGDNKVAREVAAYLVSQFYKV